MNENVKEIVNIIGNAELSNKCHKECFINTDFDNECTLCRQATALYKQGYRKQSETVKEFAEKAEQRFREDSKWLDIMLKGYDCKDSEDYDAVANAIIIGRFVNRLNDLAEQYGKEE